MCRWMAYSGNSLPIEVLLFEARHNLIDQSLASQSSRTPTNADGFGLGWYGAREAPGLFHSIRPAWNDTNLRDLAAHIDSHLYLAHVRSTSQATVQETNCHPFRHGKWLFVHNGEIADIRKLRRDLVLGVDPARYCDILGSTDSEIMFHLALSFGLERDPLGGLARMVGFVEGVGRAHGVDESIWMTVGVSDGESVWAVRYASDGKGPSLYYSRDVKDLKLLDEDAAEHLGAHARAIVSEPVGSFVGNWVEVPQSMSVHVKHGDIVLEPFAPSS